MAYLEDIMNSLIQKATSAGLSIINALVVLVVGLKLSKFLVNLLKKGKFFSKLDPTASSFIISLLSILMKALVFITAAVILGIPMTSFLTVLASCGVAIGLALQGALANFAGGLMLLIFKPFQVGDYIESNGLEGTVKGISVFYTVITTADNKNITLPNGNLTNSAVVNYSANNKRRISFSFSASYSADIDTVKNLLLKVASQNENVLPDPAPAAFVGEHKDSCVEYLLNVWCPTDKYWDVKLSIPEAVKKSFDENGIEIPFPQLDIHKK